MSDVDDVTGLLHSSMSFTETLGIRGVEASTDRVVVELDWSADLLTSGGLLHGGAVMALADTAGGTCAFLNLPDGAVGTSTIESKTNFLGGTKEGDTLRATATPLHVGGSTIVIETELNAGDRLVGKTIQTQSVLRPR